MDESPSISAAVATIVALMGDRLRRPISPNVQSIAPDHDARLLDQTGTHRGRKCSSCRAQPRPNLAL
jgi:hypothetical protein